MPAGTEVIEIRTISDESGATSNIFHGNLEFPTATVSEDVHGFVWLDVDADGIWEAGERGLGETLVTLRDSQGAVVPQTLSFEPDNYDTSAFVGTVRPEVTLLAVGADVGNSAVYVMEASLASTGAKVFGHRLANLAWNTTWSTNRQLQMDFASPMQTVSLDVVSPFSGGAGSLSVFDGDGNLLDQFTTGRLNLGDITTMSISRLQPDIAYAIAGGVPGRSSVPFDNLRFGVDSIDVTKRSGAYSFEGIAPGVYTIQATPAGDAVITFPTTGVQTITWDGSNPVTGVNFGLSLPALSLSLNRTQVLENDGNDVLTATIRRNAASGTASPLAVTLASSDEPELQLPSSATIPTGEWEVTCPVQVQDDSLLDGTQSVTLTAAATGHFADGQTLAVHDTETLDVMLTAVAVAENAGAGATTGTVTRSNTDNLAALVVTLTSSDATEATVPASVSIPAGQASATFSVTAVDDALLDGTQTVTVTASSTGYVSVADTVDVTDVETLTVAIAASSVPENAGSGATTGTVTRSNTDNGVALTVTLTSNDTSEATVPATVTIPAGQAFTTFSVAAVDDVLLDGTQAVALTASSAGYANGADTLDVADVETLTVSIAAAWIPEDAGPGATTGTVTRSNTDNGVPLIVALTSSDTTEATVRATVTIPAGRPTATFEIDAVDDLTVDGNQDLNVTAAAAGYHDGSDTFTVTDNDLAGVIVAPTAGLTTTESGEAATFTITLMSQPTADVTIGLTSSDTSEGTASPAIVTFTTANWSSPQTVTVAGANDDLDDGDVAYTIVTAAATSTDANYNGLDAADVPVTNADNDTAGITVNPASGLVTTESGGTATFAIVLNSQPTASVTIALTSSDTTEGTVSPASVSFASANWNTAQTVTVTGVNDDLADGNVAYTILTAAATSTDRNYSNVNAADAAVTNTDNDAAGITVNPTSGLVTTESGGTATFAIVLNSQPTASVTIGLTSSDTTEGTVSPASVTFTSANWNSSQTVTVTGVNDDLADGNVAYTILTAAATSTDANYRNVNAADVSVTNTDNDTAGITVDPTGSLVTTEAGGAAAFTIVLDSQPTAEVTIGLASGSTREGAVSPASVTFAPGDWSVARTVTVSGLDEALIDGDATFAILTAAAASDDAKYSGLDAADVSVRNLDDDLAGFTLSHAAVTVSENLTTATFTVALTAEPEANVVLAVSSEDVGEAVVNPALLTFVPSGWNEAQTVIVTGVDDWLIDGSQLTDLTVSVVDASSDDKFDALPDQIVSVTTVDNDVGWHNARNPFDVNGDGRIDAADVLTVINYINAHSGDSSLPPPPAAPPPYLDVNNDGQCTAGDVLAVINYINSHPAASTSGGEGEGVSRVATPPGVLPSAVAPREPTQIVSVRMQLVCDPSTGSDAVREPSSRHALDGRHRSADAVFETWPDSFSEGLADALALEFHPAAPAP